MYAKSLLLFGAFIFVYRFFFKLAVYFNYCTNNYFLNGIIFDEGFSVGMMGFEKVLSN